MVLTVNFSKIVNPFTPRVSYGDIKVILTSESVDDFLWQGRNEVCGVRDQRGGIKDHWGGIKDHWGGIRDLVGMPGSGIRLNQHSKLF